MILSSHRNTCHRYHRGNQFRIVMVFKQELKKFKWGWGFMKPFLKPITFLTALSGIATFIDTLEPLYTGRIIDMLTNFSKRGFYNALLALTAFQVGGLAISLISTWFRMLLRKKMTVHSETLLMERILDLGINQEDSGEKGNAANLFLGDLSTMMSIYHSQVPGVLLSTFTLCIVGVRLFTINTLLFFLSLAFSLIPLFLSHFFGIRQASLHKKEREIQDKYLGFLEETLSGIHEIHTDVSKKFFSGKFYNLLGKVFDLVKASTILSLKSSLAFFLSNYVTSISLFLVIGNSVLNGNNTVGQLVSALLYSQRLRSILSGFGSSYQSLLSSQVSTERIMKFFERSSHGTVLLTKQRNNETPSIILSDFSFAYVSEKPVISRLNFCFKKPGLYLIKGKNGCGKTTLLNCVAESLQRGTQSGKIVFINLKKESIAMVSQKPTIFSMTVRDNLLMGRHESEERIWTVLANLKLDKMIQTLPDGLDTVLQNEASFLSRGQNQRLVLARCILQNKEIITLDEIETSMDKDSEKILLEILPSIASNAIVLLVTHRDSFDSLAKGMLNLDNQPS